MQVDLVYPRVARAALEKLASDETDEICRAASMITKALLSGGILQVYGTGHSRIVALELAGRAGGLASVGMLSVKDLVMFGGVDPGRILDPTYERVPGIAQEIYDLAAPSEADIFFIVSNSGINSAVVEMASIVKERGHTLIALVSKEHAGNVASRSADGRNLREVADIVLDNGAPEGDAALELAPGLRIGPLSSLTGVFVAQCLNEAVCRQLLEAGAFPPVFVSANAPGGDSANEELWAQYRSRIRPIEP